MHRINLSLHTQWMSKVNESTQNTKINCAVPKVVQKCSYAAGIGETENIPNAVLVFEGLHSTSGKEGFRW